MSAIGQQVIGRAACLHEMIQTCCWEEAKTARHGALHARVCGRQAMKAALGNFACMLLLGLLKGGRLIALVMPDETYQGEKTIDLGGKQVVLHELTGGHTRGDQIVFLPHEQVLFTGDLVENHLFPILFDQDASTNRWIEELASLMHLSPATVVPGHGELGKVELLQEVQDLLIFVREEVNRRIKRGQTLDLIDQEAARIIKERYHDWGNDLWIPFEIRNVYAELTGTPLKLPALQTSRDR